MTFWRSGLEVTPKSPRFKPVALFKMQTWQIWTKKNKLKKIKIYIFSNNVLKGHLYQQREQPQRLRSLSIAGQTNQTRGRRRHMAQTD